MNKIEKKIVIETEERVNEMLSNFIAKDGKVAKKENFTWRDISKIQIQDYIGQEEVNLELFFYSKNGLSNNKPYSYHKKVSLDVAIKFRNKLQQARKYDSRISDEDLDPINNW